MHDEAPPDVVVRSYVKRRPVAVPGSIPHALDMFRNEVRFYREVAPVVGVRVPVCYRSEDTVSGPRASTPQSNDWPVDRPRDRPTGRIGPWNSGSRRQG